jgi:hypothetical protein
MPLLDTTISRAKERGALWKASRYKIATDCAYKDCGHEIVVEKLHLEYRTSLRGESLCL